MTKTEPRSVAFRRQREQEWFALEGLVDRVLKRGLSVLDEDELRALPILYRGAVSSLEVARATALDRALVEYLEGLVGRGYIAIYTSRRQGAFELLELVARGFPQAVRACAQELAVAALLMGLGVAVAWSLVAHDGSWYFAFVDPNLAGGRDPGASTETLRAALYTDGGSDGLSLFGAFLFTHNTGVGLLAFAVGLAGGIPTAYLMFSTGLMLGGFLGLYAGRGLLFPLLGWLLPHGVPEISAVLVCGAGGLAMGRAILAPGRHTSREALVRAGRVGSRLVLGAAFLFFVAGLIEGIFRQVVNDDATRFAFAAFNALWLVGWIAWGARRASGAR